ncbi:hypothetical protein N7528_007538 [Penicillium herquei]|nr:hypothetical protein N7528_007538 [Penicillium herquei]
MVIVGAADPYGEALLTATYISACLRPICVSSVSRKNKKSSDKTSTVEVKVTVEVEVTRHSKEEHEHIHEPEISSIDKADIQYSFEKDGLLEMRDQQGNVITYPAQERGDEPIYRGPLRKAATVP